MRLRSRAFAQLGELLRFAKLCQRGLRLRIGGNQVAPRVSNAEDCIVDFEAKHRLDEIEILRQPLVIDLEPRLVLQMILEIGQHRVVDNEVRLYGLAAARLHDDTRIAFGRVLLRVVGEDPARIEHPAEASRVEPFDRPGDALVRLDPAAAVNGTP